MLVNVYVQLQFPSLSAECYKKLQIASLKEIQSGQGISFHKHLETQIYTLG